MEKNNFLIYNDIVYTLYQCKSYEALRDEFLPRLRLLIPFTYASIISVNPENRTEIVPTPVCFPDYFYEAELLYIDHMSEDHLLWINNVRESQLVRESDLVNDDVRLNSSLSTLLSEIPCLRFLTVQHDLQWRILRYPDAVSDQDRWGFYRR